MKKLWNWIVNVFKKPIMTIVQIVVTRAAENAVAILQDDELATLALTAVRHAAEGGVGGREAWEKARARFVELLQEAHRDIKDVTIDTTLQLVYSGWKTTKS